MFPDLAAAISGLVVPVDGEALAEVLGLRHRFEAQVVCAVAAFDDTNEWDRAEGCASLAAWLRSFGGMSGADAARLSKTARRLRRLPGLRAAWLSGQLSGGHVAAIVANLSDRTAPLFAEQEDVLIPILAGLEPGAAVVAMKGWAAEARERLGDSGSEPDPDRTAHLSSTLSGGRLDANLDPEAFQAAQTAVRLAMGTKTDDDPRTVAQRRHDALADVFRHYLDHQAEHAGGHRRPHVNITIGLDTLTTARGQGTFDDASPVSAEAARRMACDADIHRVITRADSSVLDYGRATRVVSAALFYVLCQRDRGCRYPGCDRPAHVCDAHHIQHWIDHGETEPENLVLLCRFHHGVVHRPGWSIELEDDATVVIGYPDGRRRTSRPPDATALTRTPAA